MKWRWSLVADLHAGSTVGLAPTGGIPHPEGATLATTPTSEWLWGHYIEMLEREARERDETNPDRHGLVLVGDLTDGGMHHGQTQLYHPDPSVEKWIAQQVVDAALDILGPDYIIIVRGTPSHVGKGSSNEESIGKTLATVHGEKLVRPDEHRYGWQVFRADCDGFLMDVRHHGKLGQLPHTRESYHKRYGFDIWSSQAMYKDGRPADLAVRAHRHKYSDTGPVAPHKRGTRAIALPCWQLSTDWAYSRAFEEFPDIGLCGVVVTDGELREVRPQVVYPTLEHATWMP